MRKNSTDIVIRPHIAGVIRAFIVGMLVLIQFGFWIFLSFQLSRYSVFFYLFIELASFFIITSMVNQDRNNSFKMAWICIVVLLPISGHIMYFLWGSPDSSRKIGKRVLHKIKNGTKHNKQDPKVQEEFAKLYPGQKRLSDYMIKEKFPLYQNNELSYHAMGEDVFEAMFKDFLHAKKFILLHFFIVAEGKLWDRMHDILIKKIKEGVEVKFVYDDFGAMFRTPKDFNIKLEKEGFEVRVFNPIHKYLDKLYLNYRSHQKIVVIDGNVGYTGGINIGDEYANIVPRFGKWKDNAIRVRGDAVWGLTVTFFQMWDVCVEKGLFLEYDKYRPNEPFRQNRNFCHVISDGPANNPDNPIENVYSQMVNTAEKFLYITTPYLILEESLRNQIVIAARSGIDVRIITPNIPDKKSVKLLTNYNYGRLLKAGVRIYEYTPGFIHAKTIMNDKSAIVGTVNMDYRSFYLHYECAIWMCAKQINAEIKKDFLATIEQSEEITYAQWIDRPFYIKVYQMIFNLFQTLM